jgi:hypothetical protein
MADPYEAMQVLSQAARAARSEPLRRGNVVHLPEDALVIFCGDLHGHVRNFQKLARWADLAGNPRRHAVLQELIHGPLDEKQADRSVELLVTAADWMLEFPGRVHMLMGNHDQAELTGTPTSRSGRDCGGPWKQGLEALYGGQASRVEAGVHMLLRSLPLAARTPGRLMMSHSIPEARRGERFDPTVLDRPLTEEDLKRPGSAYWLLWGRDFSQANADRVAELLGADLLLVGHVACPQGYATPNGRMLVLAADHNAGCFVTFEAAETYTLDQLVGRVRSLAELE